MIKISNREIIDFVKYSEQKVIFVEKIPLDELGKYKVNYFVLNFENGEREAITKNAYLLKKFGSAFQSIIDEISNFVQCNAVIFPSKSVFVIFSNGQAGYFNSFGEMQKSGELKYNDSNCSYATEDGDYFWTCCKDENCVIRYTADSVKVDLRIGAKESGTFNNPIFISSDERFVYVCCEDGRIRKIDKSNFTVSDYSKTFNGLKRFYKYGRFAVICTTDGAFIDKD